MAENYVRFQRGSFDNYKALASKAKDTLYFVYDEDSPSAALYLGERLIAGIGENSGTNSLQNLNDVLVNEIANKDILVYSEEEQKWINTNFSSVLEDIKNSINFENIISSSQTIKDLQAEVQTKITQTYTQVPNVDENSGKTITEDEFNSGTYYIYKDNEYVVAGEYQADTIYYIQEVDEKGNPLFERVPDTLLTPVEKNKLDALVIGDKGQVEISGTVNIQNVQGLNGYLTEQHFSNSVNSKLNYITEVESNSFTITDSGQLLFTPKTGRLLTSEDEAQINFIQAVDTDVFNVTSKVVGVDELGSDILKNTLELKQVPIEILSDTLGDLTSLPLVTLEDGTTSNKLADNINNIYDILTWGTIAL